MMTKKSSAAMKFLLAVMLFASMFAIIATAANIQEGSTMLNYSVDNAVTRFQNISGTTVIIHEVATGTQPQVLDEAGVRMDILATTLPVNITDTNNLIAVKNFSTDIVWSALSLTLNNTLGEIRFNALIDLTTHAGNLTITGQIIIAQNNITINETGLSELNVSTLITIYDVYLTSVRLLKNGFDCTDCTINNYTANNLTFTVEGFSPAYSNFQAENESAPPVSLRIARNVTILHSNVSLTGESYNSSFPTNITLDVANDELVEYTINGTFNATNSTTNLTDALNQFIESCSCTSCTIENAVTCLMPVTLSSDTQGIVSLSQLNITQVVNNMTWPQGSNLTFLDLDDYFHDENNDSLNYTMVYRTATDAATLAYCRFDNSEICKTGEIPTVMNVSYQKAIFGQGILINNTANLTFTSSEVISVTAGTFEVWIIPEWNGSDSSRNVIFEMNASGDGNSISLYKNNSGYLVGEILDSSANIYTVTSNISGWRDHELHHLAFSWATNDMRLYIDGNLVDSITSATISSASSAELFVGSSMNNSDHLNATLDELRIQDNVTTTNYNISNRMRFALDANNTITTIPNRYFNGTMEVLLIATDGSTTTHSNIFNLTIIADTLAPTFSNNKDNSSATEPSNGDTIQLNLTISDNIELNRYIFSWNDTGSWVNDSTVFLSATGSVELIFNKTISATANANISWRVFIWDTYDNQNESDLFTFKVINTLPVSSVPVLLPSSPNRSSELNCTFTITDTDSSDTLIANISFFNNSVYYTSATETVVSAVAAFHNLTANISNKGEYWNCSVQPYDGSEYGAWVNSSSVLIQNSPPPAVTLITPIANNETTNRTVAFNWSSVTDIDGDTVKYELIVQCNNGCSADNKAVNDTETNRTLGEFQYLGDENYNYTWYIRTWDTDNAGSVSELRNYTIHSLISITFINNVVDFGTSLALGASDNTTDNSPLPLSIENDGNVLINISLYALSDLWIEKPSPTDHYQFKVDNYSIKTGSFNASESVVTFTNIPISAVQAVGYLNYTLTNNSVEIDINITVPAGEPAGTKNSTLVFTAQRS